MVNPELSRGFTGLGLGLIVLAVTALARRLPVPSPILQVMAGLALGFIPGHPIPQLDPDLVFFVFLPPVLWSAAYFTSFREFKANIRPIGLLAVGLVLVTTAVVALAATALIPGIPLAVAVALGAIVSPPDAVAAEAIIKRLPVPHRIIAILEGESLVNDASALVLYRTAVLAAVTGQFSAGETIVRFFIDAFVGVMTGLLVGWILVRAARRTHDTMAEILLTLLGPYLAWLLAESVHASAVLSCVAGGLYVRQHFSTVVAPVARLQARAVWELLIFVMNALIFLLLGLSFGSLMQEVPPGSVGSIVGIGLVISAIVILVRLIWVPLATVIPRLLSARLRQRDPMPPARAVFLISWTSMRGIVTLASALALPLAVADGSPFPHRAELIIIAMVVILVTLVVQGLSLAPIIRRFDFPAETRHRDEQVLARSEALRHALERLEDLADEPWAEQADLARVRSEYEERRRIVSGNGRQARDAVATRQRIRAEALAAERRALIRLRDEGAISDEVMQELEQELDVEAIRLDSGAR